MKISEIISEAHHSIIRTTEIGPWILDIDSHFLSSMADRSDVLNLKEVTSIVTAVCLELEALHKVPRGTGVFVQEVNSKISIYLYRYKNKPNRLRLETVLTPDMKPKEPVIRVSVPPSNNTMSKKEIKNLERVRAYTQSQGRDSYSQNLERNKDFISAMSQMNRQQRRAFNKIIKSK